MVLSGKRTDAGLELLLQIAPLGAELTHTREVVGEQGRIIFRVVGKATAYAVARHRAALGATRRTAETRVTPPIGARAGEACVEIAVNFTTFNNGFVGYGRLKPPVIATRLTVRHFAAQLTVFAVLQPNVRGDHRHPQGQRICY